MDDDGIQSSGLTLKHLGIDTQQEHIIFMNSKCPVVKSEGFEALTRIRVEHPNGTLLATLNIFRNGFLDENEVGLSENAWRDLNAQDGDTVILSHPEPLQSFSHIRSKIYGHSLDREAYGDVINDIVRQRYSDIQISSFLTAIAGFNVNLNEISYLTEAMIESGEKLDWNKPVVGDKHSLGGLPGNRTTPIVVAIVASQGVTIPKTSSRGITSPAGTADTMETITRVNLDPNEIREVVEKENGCFVWGGTAELSPADDILIKVERSLDLDSEGQMVASILSKKVAAGSTHVVIDMPVGPTAKVRSQQALDSLKGTFQSVADRVGLNLSLVPGNGDQPIGRGIGPALEARDILQVLKGKSEAPADLRNRSVELAGALLELVDKVEEGRGAQTARKVLESGEAWEKFQSICHAQGRLNEPPESNYRHKICVNDGGEVTAVDNRKLARVAKLAGAPKDPAAGIDYLVRLGDTVDAGDCLYEIHSESEGELNYALNYVENTDKIIEVS